MIIILLGVAMLVGGKFLARAGMVQKPRDWIDIGRGVFADRAGAIRLRSWQMKRAAGKR